MICKNSIYNSRWRKRNSHNFTSIGNIFPIDLVTVGKQTYGIIYAAISSEKRKLRIGNYCSIASGVKFLVSMEHPLNYISTYPFRVMCLGDKYEALSKGDIIVEDDVWIGENAIILSGVHICQGAVIAAGAVVSHDVPPYAIVGGVPDRLIKYRFKENIKNELLKVDYGKLQKDQIAIHIDELYSKILTGQQIRDMDGLLRKLSR